MGNRIKGFTVSLKEDLKLEDCKYIFDAVRMIKGVLDVSPMPNDHGDFIISSKIKAEVRDELFKLIDKL